MLAILLSSMRSRSSTQREYLLRKGCKSEYSMTARWNFIAYIMNLIKIQMRYILMSTIIITSVYGFTYWIWKCRQICVIKISALIFDRVKLNFSVHHYSWVMHCPYWTIIDLHRSSKKSTLMLTWPVFKMPLLSARLIHAKYMTWWYFLLVNHHK